MSFDSEVWARADRLASHAEQELTVDEALARGWAVASLALPANRDDVWFCGLDDHHARRRLNGFVEEQTSVTVPPPAVMSDPAVFDYPRPAPEDAVYSPPSVEYPFVRRDPVPAGVVERAQIAVQDEIARRQAGILAAAAHLDLI